jgi:hypothetical protein
MPLENKTYNHCCDHHRAIVLDLALPSRVSEQRIGRNQTGAGTINFASGKTSEQEIIAPGQNSHLTPHFSAVIHRD